MYYYIVFYLICTLLIGNGIYRYKKNELSKNDVAKYVISILIIAGCCTVYIWVDYFFRDLMQ